MTGWVVPAIIGNVGPMELLVILLILLLLFGASRLAGLGAAAGKTIKEFRKAIRDVEDEASETKPEKPSA
jgi:sec-independent protein translocase protein TatA